mmetsp:Transcript_26102/g.67155  ORF Transcript_26102/g.67155 Transcript_26102/m.67155 type:complete len:373 (+) Transcript_26102:1883-3001(+)
MLHRRAASAMQSRPPAKRRRRTRRQARHQRPPALPLPARLPPPPRPRTQRAPGAPPPRPSGRPPPPACASGTATAVGTRWWRRCWRASTGGAAGAGAEGAGGGGAVGSRAVMGPPQLRRGEVSACPWQRWAPRRGYDPAGCGAAPSALMKMIRKERGRSRSRRMGRRMCERRKRRTRRGWIQERTPWTRIRARHRRGPCRGVAAATSARQSPSRRSRRPRAAPSRAAPSAVGRPRAAAAAAVAAARLRCASARLRPKRARMPEGAPTATRQCRLLQVAVMAKAKKRPPRRLPCPQPLLRGCNAAQALLPSASMAASKAWKRGSLPPSRGRATRPMHRWPCRSQAGTGIQRHPPPPPPPPRLPPVRTRIRTRA